MRVKKKHEIQRYYNQLLYKNFMSLAPTACILYPLLSYIDYGQAKGNFLLFLGLRILFILPTLIGYLWLRKIADKSNKLIAVISYLSFVFSGTGVSVISYFLGGITSDYYFGVLIISFLQFTFVPLAKRWSILLDLFFVLFFFGLNTYNHDYDQALLVRQISNFLSFALFKFIAVNRSRKHIFDSIENISLVKELNSRTNVQNIFGELCHLINNPLFISTNVTKKAMKAIPSTPENNKTHELLTKSLTAQYRIGTVIEKMLSLQSDKDVDINQYKEFLTTESDPISEENDATKLSKEV